MRAVPEPTKSDRVSNQATFKEALRSRYNCINPSNPDTTKCMVLNAFFATNSVHAAHLVSISDRLVTKLLGFENVWDVRNGLLLYGDIDTYYGNLELVFMPNPTTHKIHLRVLYDSLLTKAINPPVSLRTIGIDGKGNVTYGDINNRELQLPLLTFPFRRALLRHAQSAYAIMSNSAKDHVVGKAGAPDEDSWPDLVKKCASISECSGSAWAMGVTGTVDSEAQLDELEVALSDVNLAEDRI